MNQGKRYQRMEETRAQVLREAVVLFLSQGYRETTLDQIATRTGRTKSAVLRAQMLRDRGAEAVALASCITKGNPIGFPGPTREMMLAAIRRKLGDDFPVLEYTH